MEVTHDQGKIIRWDDGPESYKKRVAPEDQKKSDKKKLDASSKEFFQEILDSLADPKAVVGEVRQRMERDGLKEDFEDLMDEMSLDQAVFVETKSDPAKVNQSRDEAMAVDQKRGRIDFDSSHLNLNFKQDQGFGETFDGRPAFQPGELQGLYPVILDIHPLQNYSAFFN